MRNIFKIFFADVKRISTNVVAVVVILGLCILPSLYAWFNILSNWDPYGPSATRNLKIAVASDDEGVTILGNSVNVGSSVISALESNTTMGWVFTDTTDEAIDGVYDSDPKINPDAKKYDTITIQEVIDKQLAVVDLTASIMCMENHVPMAVFSLNEKDGIVNAMRGKINGTVVTA